MRKEEREDIIEELAMVLCHIDGRYRNDLTLVEVSDYKKKTELVCLKVDRELPEQPSFTSYPKDRSDGRPNMTYQIFKAGQRSLIDAGYVAVSPLIEEKK